MMDVARCGSRSCLRRSIRLFNFSSPRQEVTADESNAGFARSTWLRAARWGIDRSAFDLPTLNVRLLAALTRNYTRSV
ncbi:MAG: hypothetical protein CMJ18_03550 [Phycisphaeraceae bacterium]|nr:hypothetical protein [Phycisphaeraceae bacterium]